MAAPAPPPPAFLRRASHAGAFPPHLKQREPSLQRQGSASAVEHSPHALGHVEVEQVLQRLGFHLDDVSFHELFDEVDGDGDGHTYEHDRTLALALTLTLTLTLPCLPSIGTSTSTSSSR